MGNKNRLIGVLGILVSILSILIFIDRIQIQNLKFQVKRIGLITDQKMNELQVQYKLPQYLGGIDKETYLNSLDSLLTIKSKLDSVEQLIINKDLKKAKIEIDKIQKKLKITKEHTKSSMFFGILNNVYADTEESGNAKDISPPLKEKLVIGLYIFVCLLCMISAIVAYKTKNELAADIVKACLGFIFGALTGTI